MRLIDANEALEIIDNYKKSISITAKTEPVISAIEDIVRFICPAIDAEPVVHGHWIRYCDGAELQLTCNKCGYDYIEADPDCTEEHKFCPHCGIKMDEEKECQIEKK